MSSSHTGSGVTSVKRHGSMSSSAHSQRGLHGDLPHHELSHTLPAHHHYDTEWEAKEELRLRELEEARSRAAQMEKTMRWWSDCTANWREKWSKVRTERNKAREEARMLRTKLETSMKEYSTMKREKQELDGELQCLRREVEKLKIPYGPTALVTANSGMFAAERDASAISNVAVATAKVSGEFEKPTSDVPKLLNLKAKARPVTGMESRHSSSNNNNNIINNNDDNDSCVVESRVASAATITTTTTTPQPEKNVQTQASPITPSSQSGLKLPANFQLTPDMEFLDKLLQPRLEFKDLGSLIEGDDGSEEVVSRDVTGDVNDCFNETEKADHQKKKVVVTHSKLIDDLPTPEQDLAEQKVCMLQLRLEEASKTIQAEREEKSGLHKSQEKLQQELSDLKLKFEEMKQSKHDAIKESNGQVLTQVKAEHQDEMENIRLDLEDETNSRSSMDRRLADLRVQLETLQAENAMEWGKRERLETEKLMLERENKKLRTQIEDFEDRLGRKHKQFSSASDADLKALQQDMHDKNKDNIPGISSLKELSDLKHAHNKLKKMLQDKMTELGHAARRAEQFEAEVKKLRARVEELKKELAAAEDEVDSATNNIRRLQRTNDELQEQVDSLQVQVEHLQTRLRSSHHSLLAHRGTSGLLQVDNFSEDDNTEY